MSSLSPGQCRAARALLGWTQKHLAARSSVTQRAIADFERGARTPYARTLKDVIAAFEEAGISFINPEEEVGGQGVRLRWGVEPALRQGGDDDDETSPQGGRSRQALPDDPDLQSLFEYWRQRPKEWNALSEPSRGAVLTEIFGSIPDVDPIMSADGTA